MKRQESVFGCSVYHVRDRVQLSYVFDSAPSVLDSFPVFSYAFITVCDICFVSSVDEDRFNAHLPRRFNLPKVFGSEQFPCPLIARLFIDYVAGSQLAAGNCSLHSLVVIPVHAYTSTGS